MANLYTADQLGIKAPASGFQEGGWYAGRQYWGGQFSDPGVINPLSNQQGAGQAVSKEVNAASAAQQGVSAQQLESYLQQQRDIQTKQNIQPSNSVQAPTSELHTGAGTSENAAATYAAPTTSLNLPDLYKSLYDSQGISELELSLNEKAKAYSDAQTKINDNPFLSEGNRTGRIQKLTNDYNNSVKNDQDLLTMKKQDIATQLDLATKQFDIESTSAKQALDQFNVLLQSGALAGASGADIANITKATGISSSMIQSAINSQKKKDVQTSVTTVDDGKNIYSVVINTQTGEIISKQAISASKPVAASASSQKESDQLAIQDRLRTDARSGWTLADVFARYTGYLDPNTIIQLYNANSSFGPAKESADYLANTYGVKPATSQPSAQEQYYQKILGNQ